MKICDYGCGQESRFQLKNGKFCCSIFYQSCPEARRKNSEGLKLMDPFTRFYPNSIKKVCRFCNLTTVLTNWKKHEKICYLNPINIKLCPVCNEPIRNYRWNKTCSHNCANRSFKQNTRFYEKEEDYCDGYKRICFRYHKRQCAICEETRIVDVHHLDKNNKNNKPENLLPLCPTHHKYIHCRYKGLIIERVEKYINDFKEVYRTGLIPAFQPARDKIPGTRSLPGDP